jgi:hypothetical protein
MNLMLTLLLVFNQCIYASLIYYRKIINNKFHIRCPLIQSTALVLVAVVNNLRDLEIARLLGWYRVPLRSAPKVVAVDYLAFYQTGAFGQEKWRIQSVAPVRGHELTTRAELLRDEPDHPRAREEYYKIQIGALEQLEQPVLAEN